MITSQFLDKNLHSNLTASDIADKRMYDIMSGANGDEGTMHPTDPIPQNDSANENTGVSTIQSTTPDTLMPSSPIITNVTTPNTTTITLFTPLTLGLGAVGAGIGYYLNHKEIIKNKYLAIIGLAVAGIAIGVYINNQQGETTSGAHGKKTHGKKK